MMSPTTGCWTWGFAPSNTAFLVTEPTVKRMASMGPRRGLELPVLHECEHFRLTTMPMPAFFTHEQKVKGVAVGKGARETARMMNEQGVFIIGGSDMFGLPFVEMIKEDITCNVDAGFTPAQALKHWTGNAGIVLTVVGSEESLSDLCAGHHQAEAYADLLLWDANPLDDIKVILDEDNLDLIMKDGTIYKDEM